MATIAEYFEMNRPKPVWQIGDRVSGKWNKIPFIGTVAVDNMVSEALGPQVRIFLDLPIKFEEEIHTVITVKQDEIKRLKVIK